jgi:hypothetical protein
MSEIEKVEKKLWDKEQLIQKWFHSRKAAIYIAVFVVGTVAFFIHRLDGGQWTELIKWTTSGYLASNAVAGIADSLQKSDSGTGS